MNKLYEWIKALYTPHGSEEREEKGGLDYTEAFSLPSEPFVLRMGDGTCNDDIYTLIHLQRKIRDSTLRGTSNRNLLPLGDGTCNGLEDNLD